MIRDWIEHPVFQRESRILSRGRVPALLFLAGPILMGLILFVGYFSNYMRTQFDTGIIANGRPIFKTLAISLFWMIMLFVPALAGASINKDRASGGLTSLRMTALSSWSILLAKCAAFGVFFSLVYLSILPILGLTFLLGGVAPSELFGVYLLTLACAMQCVLLSVVAGLASRQSSTAIIVGFILSLIYLIALPFSLDLGSSLCFYLYGRFSGESLMKLGEALRSLSSHYAVGLFPIHAVSEVLAPEAASSFTLLGMRIPVWTLSLVSVAVTSTITMGIAVLLLRLELWNRPAGQTALNRMMRKSRFLYKMENLLNEEKNPFWDWERRRHPVILFRPAIIVVLIAATIGVMFLFGKTMPETFQGISYVVLVISALLVTLVPIFYCSQTVVREKEMGTYDALILTLLQPQQVIHSKLKSSMMYILPFLVVSGMFVFFAHFSYRDQYSMGFTPFVQVNFVWLGVQIVRCLYFAMLGVFCSLYCRSSVRALAYTLGLEVLLTIPYKIFQGLFTCCGGMALMGYRMHSPSGSDFFSMLAHEYSLSILLGTFQVIFMLVVIRILYDRAINLMRFESYRR